MQDSGSRLGPVRTDVPPARQTLALALRAQFAHLRISVRGYGAREPRAASAITRYLNGSNLPPEDFVTNLLDEVANMGGDGSRSEATRVMELYRAAQDAQPGSWGHTKRLKQQAAKAAEQLRAAELDKQAAIAAHNATLLRLNEVQAALDQSTGPAAEEPLSQRDHSSEHAFLQLELERTQTELTASRTLLDIAERRIGHLEAEVLRLKRPGRIPVQAPITERKPWYRAEEHRPAYWGHYVQLLDTQGWSPAGIQSLDAATDQIVSCLADPSAPSPYQARGMVLGYVQSGATAHIAGLIAKSIDVGYRLVIVLTGAHNALRRQLQQRLDQELPSLPDTAGIIRLTTPETDYQRLAEHLASLRFEKRLANRPLFVPENIGSASVRLMVVKKNTAVLNRLVKDLVNIGTPLDEVPALIIDADPTHDPGTAIDNRISQLQVTLPRAQYIAFTSTPFVPALTNPDTSTQSFPRDFVVSLPRPDGYVGTHELFSHADGEARSSIRHIEPDETGLQEALDMFVLTGALKVYRDASGEPLFAHHLMFVQTSGLRAAQDQLRARIHDLWRADDYSGSRAQERLQRLFETEFIRAPADARAPLPASFRELQPALRAAITRLEPDPTAAGDESTGWHIVVTGQPTSSLLLSEPPTIIYLDADSGQKGALLGLQHTFGRRPGYEDLCRTYISNAAESAAQVDLHLEQMRREDAVRVALADSTLEPAMLPPVVAAAHQRPTQDAGPQPG